jgi:hypothetical protein
MQAASMLSEPGQPVSLAVGTNGGYGQVRTCCRANTYTSFGYACFALHRVCPGVPQLCHTGIRPCLQAASGPVGLAMAYAYYA